MGVVFPKLLEYKAMDLGKVCLKSTDLRTSAQKGVGGPQCINSLNMTILDSKLRLKQAGAELSHTRVLSWFSLLG